MLALHDRIEISVQQQPAPQPFLRSAKKKVNVLQAMVERSLFQT
jgi:hypothetical protein